MTNVDEALENFCGGCGCEVDDREGWTSCSGGGPGCGDRCPDCGTCRHNLGEIISLEWVSKDRQSGMGGGEHPAGVDRAEAEAAFLAELLEQCGEDYQREAILAGRMVWV